MGMMSHGLPPGMQNREEPNPGAEPFPIGRDGLERLSRSPKQHAIQESLVLERKGGESLRERENNVEVLNGEQLGLTVMKPFGSG